MSITRPIGLAITLLAACNLAWAEQPNKAYRLGRGLELGGGFRLGGYASTKIQGLAALPWSLNISDASLFVIWDGGNRLRYFSETEVEDPLTAGSQQSLTAGSAKFKVERLYFDYLVTESLTVRLGKALTPVGQWNLIHADPLVWTTTRPVATENLFSQHLSGVMLYGNILLSGKSLEYTVYGDYSSALDFSPNSSETILFDKAAGGRLRYSVNENLIVGASYVDFSLKERPNLQYHLTGLDFIWSSERYVVNSEIVYRNNSSETKTDIWQGYIQAVCPFYGPVSAVSRYEFFDQSNQQLGQVGLLGLAYRPSQPVIWKLEYRLGRNNRNLAPNGLFASFSVLF